MTDDGNGRPAENGPAGVDAETVAAVSSIAVPKYEWIDVIRRAKLGRTTKQVALMIATYADGDGTSAYPGVARLAVQCGVSYRTVQYELARLRAMGLLAPQPRKGRRRVWLTEYWLIFDPDVLDRVDVPTPAAEDAEIEALMKHHRGRHRRKSARNPDGMQFRDCTQWDGPTARNGPLADLRRCHHYQPWTRPQVLLTLILRGWPFLQAQASSN